MEDGDISEMEVSASIKAAESNDLFNKMANYPDVEVTVIKNKNTTDCKTSDSPTKVNGESERVNNYSDDQEEFSSDDDALIIDEDIKSVETKPNVNHKRLRSPSPRANFKGFKKRIIAKSYHSLKIANEIRKFYQLDDKEEILQNHKEESNKQGELNATITKDSITQCLINDSDIKTGSRDNCTLTDQKLKKSLTAASTHIESLKHKQHVTTPSLKSSGKRPIKKRPSQKLTEYAQYLGLQPAVKFKCVKCSESSFPSLSALNEHQRQCLVQLQSNTNSKTATTTTTTTTKTTTTTSAAASSSAGGDQTSPAPVPTSSSPSTSTNFRVTRKVFLCSSCGTYYENCNLFLHMREVHRRYICLYCLGMFSLPEKLSHHLVTKHNCLPSHYSSAEDFLNSYSESCFLVCCHCERVFSERDNFFDHVCVEKRATLADKSCWSCGIKGSSGVHLPTCTRSTSNTTTAAAATTTTTASNATTIDQPPSTSAHNQKQNNKSIHPKSQKHKATKNSQKTAVTPVQHVTADSSTSTTVQPPSPVSLGNDNDNEDDDRQTGGHFLADIGSLTTNMSDRNETNPPVLVENTDLNENSTKNISDMDICDTKEKILNEITNKQNHTLESAIEENELSNHSNSENVKHEHEEKNTTTIPKENSMNNDLEENHSDSQEEKIIPENRDTSETSASQITQENVVDTSQNCDNEQNCRNDDDVEEREIPKEPVNDDNIEANHNTPVEETRKVPKVTLKLPPQGLIYSENESDDSEKLTMEVDENYDSDNDCDEPTKSLNESEKPVNGIEDSEKNHSDLNQSDDDSFQVAGEDVSIIELELEQPLDKFNIADLIKTCLGATIPTCIYCNHARKIAVNGKQLGYHAIAEHRFSATVNSITAEELIPKNFVQRIKEGLEEIEFLYFSLEEQEKVEDATKEDAIPMNTAAFKRFYECFQCRFVTTIHKELYLHNRKMHAKTILLCIMCKSNFYSYSELICHLCPGNYVLNSETKFRCCMCDSNDLPSAFRLMVHLRKKHSTCDVCLEGCHNQSKLSNHVWKHKLHHLCYRCGIAYRNKPDITKHLFWKHGTESVLCKKCLQKKWPHVYHFCVPPLTFVCEECNFSFSKAVYLKVHKRLHINEKPHACPEEHCAETFISKKLLLKHEMKHRDPLPIEIFDAEPTKESKDVIDVEAQVEEEKPEHAENNKESTETPKEESTIKEPGSPDKEEQKAKNLMDVYDLPALNLSESDSDSEDEKPNCANATEPPSAEEKMNVDEKPENLPNILPAVETPVAEIAAPTTTTTNENVDLPIEEENQKPVPILDGIWDNFKNYQATIEKIITSTEIVENIPDINVILADHDYCLPQTTAKDVVMKNDESTGLDHDYCTVSSSKMHSSHPTSNSAAPLDEERPALVPGTAAKKKVKAPKKKTSSSSDSSSDSDSSSCTCGSNCSCSSSSGSSSSSSSSSDSDSSSSEGKRRIAARRERRKERAKQRKKESETSHVTNVDVVATEDPVVPVAPPVEIPILESDLETDETETDEDFYDEYPQRLANKILAEKRNQLALLASVAPVTNGAILECSRPSTPSIPEEAPIVPKKKAKSKKRKKKSRSSTPKHEMQQPHIPEYMNHHHHHHHSPMPVQQALPHAHNIPSPLSIHSLPATPQVQTVPPLSLTLPPKSQLLSQNNTPGSGSETETSVRSSKRRRVPNKFYGYSSDEEGAEKPPAAPVLKWRKADLPTPPSHVTGSPQLVPPITIKNIPSPAPVVEPIRTAPIMIHHQSQSEVQESDSEPDEVQQRKSATDSTDDDDDDDDDNDDNNDNNDNNRNDDSDSDGGQLHISQPQPRPPVFPPGPHHGHSHNRGHSHSHGHGHHSRAGLMMQGERNENLYCYCQCPYDEVSEMIACDGKDCAIEWFHFECVGIMVPPKGKWFCPDCRKRNSQRSDLIQT